MISIIIKIVLFNNSFGARLHEREKIMKSNDYKIGVFVVFGLVLIMGSIFFLGANRTLFGSSFEIYADFSNVQGLYDGSVVSLSGIEIGNVEKINFTPETNQLRVKMKIDKNFQSRLRAGIRAEINTQGALGDKYIHLIPGNPLAEVIKAGSVIETTEGNGILDVISNRGKETERVFDIINEIYKMTKGINQDNKINKIIEQLSSTTNHLSAASSDIRRFTSSINEEDAHKKFKASVVHMESILSKIDKGEGTLGALINDPALHERLKSILGADQRKSHVRSLLRTSIQETEK